MYKIPQSSRTLSGAHKRDHITPVLKQLNWLPVKSRIDYKILIITYKALFGNGPEYIRELLKFHTPTRTLRSGNDTRILVEPKTRLSTAGDRSYYKGAPHLWNQLPKEIRHAPSLRQFKTGLKTFLYRRDYGS